MVFQTLTHWQQDSDLASVREVERIAELPQSERTEWQSLWQRVRELQAKAASSKEKK